MFAVFLNWSIRLFGRKDRTVYLLVQIMFDGYGLGTGAGSDKSRCFVTKVDVLLSFSLSSKWECIELLDGLDRDLALMKSRKGVCRGMRFD